MKRKKIASLVCVVAIGLSSCEVEPIQTEKGGLSTTICLKVRAEEQDDITTRAINENEIADLHVLVYNSKGELTGKAYGIGSTITLSTLCGKGNHIYVIANTANEKLFESSTVVTEAELKELTTGKLASWDEIGTNDRLIMTGSKEVDIDPSTTTITGGISVFRIAAKVTLTITAKENSNITIYNYRILGLPRQSYYVVRPLKTENEAVDEYITGNDAVVLTNKEDWTVSPVIPVVAADNNVISTTFYMYENRCGSHNEYTTQEQKIRYSENSRRDSASCVQIVGEDPKSALIWRVCLGADPIKNYNIKRDKSYTYDIILSHDKADARVSVTSLLEPIKGGNENCYMLQSGASVDVPVERANEGTIEIDGSIFDSKKNYYQIKSNTVWEAELVWESSPNLITLTNNSGTGALNTQTSAKNAFTVTASSSIPEGNAVVAVKNKTTGDILWSWHIWVTDYQGDFMTLNNEDWEHEYDPAPDFAETWGVVKSYIMDRPLGAASNTKDQLASCGLYYQWGRKDPFPGLGQKLGSWTANNADPVMVYNKQGNEVYTMKASVNIPADKTNNLTSAIRNPFTFYTSPNDIYDWFATKKGNDLLWGQNSTMNPGRKTVYDPCPKGWRVPYFKQYTSPMMALIEQANDPGGHDYHTYSSSTSGVTYGVAFTRSDTYVKNFWHYTGMRSFKTGNFESVGKNTGSNAYSYHWLATSMGTKSSVSVVMISGIQYHSQDSRATGMPLRCQKE